MQYQYGTVSVTNDSETVIGDGTVDWTELKASVDNGNPVFFSVIGANEATYSVSSVTTPELSTSGFWELTITAKYTGSTAEGVGYMLHKDFTPKLGLPLMAYGDRQAAAIVSRAMQTIDDKSHALTNGLYHVQADLTPTASLAAISDLDVLPEGEKYYRGHYGLLFTTTDVTTVPQIQFAWTTNTGPPDENITYFAGIARAIVAAAGTGAEWQGALTQSTSTSNTLTLASLLANNWYMLDIDVAYRFPSYVGTLAPLMQLNIAKSGGAGTLTIGAGSYLITTEFE